MKRITIPAALILIAVLCGWPGANHVGVSTPVIGAINVYGDSLSNEGHTQEPNLPSLVQWGDPLTDAGLTIRGMAAGGANARIVTPVCESTGYILCWLSGESAATHIDGVCRSWNAVDDSFVHDNARCTGLNAADPCCTGSETGNCNKTCILDQPSRLHHRDIDVFFFGSNDIGTGTLAQWTDTDKPLTTAAYELMMDDSEAAGHGCVVVLAPPSQKTGSTESVQTDKMEDLADWITTDVATNRPGCEVADVYSIFRDVYTGTSAAAMWRMYGDGACDTADGDACVHPKDGPTATEGLFPHVLMGTEILRAVLVAHTKDW